MNVAARLESLAEPGAICISGTVYDAVGVNLPMNYEYMGEQRVKNIDRPIRAYHASIDPDVHPPRKLLRGDSRVWIAAVVVIIVGVGVFTRFNPWSTDVEPVSLEEMAFALPDKPSVVVLPFDNMSGDKDQEYFADGITEDLTTDLAKLSGLFVIARNSAFTYKGRAVAARQVAEELGVQFIIEGSVRRVGDEVRINAQVIDAISGHHLWADRYDGSLADIFSLQDSVVKEVVSALSVRLSSDESDRSTEPETDNPEAYIAALQGWDHYHRQSAEDAEKAVAYFEKAIELDPQYSRAYAGLGRVYWDISNHYWYFPLNITWQHSFAKENLAMAMKVPPSTADAHSLAAEINVRMGRHDQALREIERAIALGPSIADNTITKGIILNAIGRAEEAEVLARRAMRLDPLSKPSYPRLLGQALLHQRRYEEAAKYLELATNRVVNDVYDMVSLASVYGHLGRLDDAKAAVDKYHEIYGTYYATPMTVQESDKWWHGDMFDYHQPYKDILLEGLRKAGVPEGLGPADDGFDYRQLVTRTDAVLTVDGAPKIDLETAKSFWERGVKFVDVRDTISFNAGHIPGARNLDLHVDFDKKHLSELLSSDEEVAISCWGEECPYAAHACAKALTWGFSRVYYFPSGFQAWSVAGYPVEADD